MGVDVGYGDGVNEAVGIIVVVGVQPKIRILMIKNIILRFMVSSQ